MRKRKQVSFTLPPDMLEDIDTRRGPINRSLYIELAIRQGLKDIDANGLNIQGGGT